MKSLFTLFLTLLISFAYSQQAADFTLEDINGESFNLYEKLDNNKAVLIDFSATWCGPCWSLHNSGVLEDLYEELGPEGEDILDVIYIESDPATNEDCLYGLSSCTGGTQGDWITGTKYRFFNPGNNMVQSSYGINAYPTLVLISAIDKQVIYEDHSITFAGIKELVESEGILSQELDLEMVSVNASKTACGTYPVTVDLRNKSLVDQDDVVVNLYINDELYDSQSIDGTLFSGESASLTFEDVAISTDDSDVVRVEIGNEDSNDLNNSKVAIVDRVTSNNKMTIFIAKNTKQGATKYKIYDGAGEVLYESGSIQKSKDHDETYSIPVLGCIDIVFEDSFDDGIVGTDALTISDNSGTVIYKGDAPGGYNSFGVEVSEIVNNSEIPELEQFTLYPNPTNSLLHIDYSLTSRSDVVFEIYNHLGTKVMSESLATQANGNHKMVKNVDELASGMYFIHLRINGNTQSIRFVKQ